MAREKSLMIFFCPMVCALPATVGGLLLSLTISQYLQPQISQEWLQLKTPSELKILFLKSLTWSNGDKESSTLTLWLILVISLLPRWGCPYFLSNNFEAVVAAWDQLLRAVAISKIYQAAYHQNTKMEKETMVTSILAREIAFTEWKNAGCTTATGLFLWVRLALFFQMAASCHLSL